MNNCHMPKKPVSSFIALLLLSCCANSKPITGYWVGSMAMNGKAVDLALDLTSPDGVLSSNDLMILREPISRLKYENGNIRFSIRLDVEMSFEGTVDNDIINGIVNVPSGPPNITIRFDLAKKSEQPPAKPYEVEKLAIAGKGVLLSAEVFTPETKKPHPALVLLHGSSMNLKKQYSFYADFFAGLGFEVLLFDKRGSGESTGNYAASRYGDLIDDAVSCLEFMKNRASVDKNKIGLWGYSQGAMLLPMIATKTDIPAFLLAKSPEVFGATEGGAYSDGLRILNRGNTPGDAQIVAQSYRTVEKMIREGSDYKEVENFINQNARKYGFMDQTGLYGSITINKSDFEGYYWKDRTIDFYPYWEKLEIPTLALFGEDDDILNAVKNESALKSLHRGNIETKMFPRAGHNLKKAFNPAKYSDFDWPRAIPGYLETMKKWLAQEVLN
jgi:pimeloyl-ACP methyl ester carboxylesterase